MTLAELEGKLAALAQVANEERTANSANGVAQVLVHRVSVMEETLRGLLANQHSILEHVRIQRAPVQSRPQPDVRGLLAALAGISTGSDQ